MFRIPGAGVDEVPFFLLYMANYRNIEGRWNNRVSFSE
jgi:hypothetical protein